MGLLSNDILREGQTRNQYLINKVYYQFFLIHYFLPIKILIGKQT